MQRHAVKTATIMQACCAFCRAFGRMESTQPCDEGLKYDIEAAKAMGLNLLRKHIKVEPDRS